MAEEIKDNKELLLKYTLAKLAEASRLIKLSEKIKELYKIKQENVTWM